MPRTVLLWRHGRTGYNVENRFQGQSDIPLDDVGRQQVQAVAPVLARFAPSLIVSSDLARARDTAAALAALSGAELRLDPGLREAFADRWQGRTRGEILRDDPDGFARWHADPLARPGGGGETRHEVGARVAAAIARHLDDVGVDATAVFVTHGGSARAGIGTLLGLPVAVWQNIAVLANCAWAELEHDPDRSWRLRAYNVVQSDGRRR